MVDKTVEAKMNDYIKQGNNYLCCGQLTGAAFLSSHYFWEHSIISIPNYVSITRCDFCLEVLILF
jgi:hypothetical protein